MLQRCEQSSWSLLSTAADKFNLKLRLIVRSEIITVNLLGFRFAQASNMWMASPVTGRPGHLILRSEIGICSEIYKGPIMLL